MKTPQVFGVCSAIQRRFGEQSKTLIFLGAMSVICGQGICEEIIHRFGKGSYGDPAWSRQFNPTLKYFRLEPAGWVIDFQPKPAETNGDEVEVMRPGNFKSRFAVSGDFEVAVQFKIDQIDTPIKGTGTGLILRMEEESGGFSIGLGHTRNTKGELQVFASIKTKEGTPFFHAETVQGFVNGLTIRRQGTQWQFVSHPAGRQPTLIVEREGPEGVANFVQILANSGGAATRMKATVQSIRVVAQGMPLGKPIPEENTPWWIYFASGFCVLLCIAIAGVIRQQIRADKKQK